MSTRPFAWIDLANVPGLLDWAGIGLGIVGFGLTLFQLFRSRGALNAAANALRDTRATLIKNQLMAVLPVFEEISSTLDGALGKRDRDELQQTLGRFSNRAEESAALLTDSTEVFATFVQALISVSDEASEARSALFLDETTSVAEIAGPVASRIRELAPKIVGVQITIKNDPGKVKNARR